MLEAAGSYDGAIAFGAPTPAVATLQQALVALAAATRDNRLAAGGQDGLLGDRTRAAVNLAMSKYVQGAPAVLRTGRLSFAAIRKNAVKLANFITEAANSAKPRPSTQLTPGAAAVVGRQGVRDLQNTIRLLAPLVEDRAFLIAVDGAVGPETTGAVNRALRLPQAASFVPATMRAGTFNVAAVRAAVDQLTQVINGIVKGLQQKAKSPATPPPRVPESKPEPVPTPPVPAPPQRIVEQPAMAPTPPVIPAPVPTPAEPSTPEDDAAPAVAPSLPSPPPRPAAPSVAASTVRALQQALTRLGGLTGDRALAVRDTGVVDPATRRAVNYAFTTYIKNGEAPPDLRTGNLTIATIAAAAPDLVGYVEAEAARVQADKDTAVEAEARAARIAAEAQAAEAARQARAARETVPVPGKRPFVPPPETVAPAVTPDVSPVRQDVVAPPPDVPSATPPAVEDKKFPWGLALGIGGGAVALGLIAFLAFGKDSDAADTVAKRPRRRRFRRQRKAATT